MDAPAELLAALRSEGFDVAPASQFDFGRGIQCSVSKVRWLADTEVKVEGGYLYSELGGAWGDFVLKNQEGE